MKYIIDVARLCFRYLSDDQYDSMDIRASYKSIIIKILNQNDRQ